MAASGDLVYLRPFSHAEHSSTNIVYVGVQCIYIPIQSNVKHFFLRPLSNNFKNKVCRTKL